MTIGEKIKMLRINFNLTQEELATAAKTTKQTIHKYETGIISNIPASKIKAIADKLNTTPAYLMGWNESGGNDQYIRSTFDNILPIKTKRVPLLGEIACGEPIFANEEHGEYVLSDGIDADFCLRAKGDSMIGARIYDGDIVYIRQQPNVDNGQIAAVLIGDEATLKRVYYYPEKNKFVLNAENPAYEPLVYVGEELNEIRILGRAVAFQSIVR